MERDPLGYKLSRQEFGALRDSMVNYGKYAVIAHLRAYDVLTPLGQRELVLSQVNNRRERKLRLGDALMQERREVLGGLREEHRARHVHGDVVLGPQIMQEIFDELGGHIDRSAPALVNLPLLRQTQDRYHLLVTETGVSVSVGSSQDAEEQPK